MSVQELDTPGPTVQSDVVGALTLARRRVGEVAVSDWARAVRARDPVDTLKRGLHRPVICRAYYKLCEMQKLLPEPERTHKILFLCEAPGGFFQAARRIYPNASRHVTSLVSGIDFNPMVKPSVVESLPFDGDIRRRAVTDTLSTTLGAHSMDLITGDGGTSHENLDLVEQASVTLLIAQTACALKMQAPKGTFVVKIFEGSTQVTQDIVSLLREVYKNVLLYKPKTSKAANSERYVIARELVDPQKASRYADELFGSLDRGMYVHRLFDAPDPRVSKAFEALAIKQIEEIDALIRATQTGDLSECYRKSKEDVSWMQVNVPCLSGCVARAIAPRSKRHKPA